MVGQRKKVKIFMLTETFIKPARILQHVFNLNCFLISNFFVCPINQILKYSILRKQNPIIIGQKSVKVKVTIFEQ